MISWRLGGKGWPSLGREDYMFSVQLLPEKLMKIMQIKRSTQEQSIYHTEWKMFFSATPAQTSFEAQWDQGSTECDKQLDIAGWNL